MSKTITIISTTTWDDGTLFGSSAVKPIENDNIEKKINEQLGEINWTCYLDDTQLEYITKDFLESRPWASYKDLKTDSGLRKEALQVGNINNFVTNKDKYKEELKRRKLYRVGGLDVYGIHALQKPLNANKWVKTLLDIASTIHNNEHEELSVNLFLHDKDVRDQQYQQPIVQADINNLLPYETNPKCMVIFFQHTQNCITDILKNTDLNKVQGLIKTAVDIVRVLPY